MDDLDPNLPGGDPDTPLQEAEAAIPVRALRYCGVCGSAWNVDWDFCHTCADRAARKSQHPEMTVKQEERSIVKVVALYASLLGISAISMLVAGAQGGELALFGLSVEEIAFAVVVLLWSAASYSLLLGPLLSIGPWRWLLSAPVMGLGTFIVASLAVLALQRGLGVDDLRYLEVFEDAGYGLGLATVFIAVQPAIFEELAFRGVIYGTLRQVTGSTEAILVSAAMFAILHLAVPSFLHLFLMGVVLAWMRERSGSLYPGMVLHFTHNFLCLVQEQSGVVMPW